jgi:ABC-type multidrug transport system fused ATPase/permease subunit
MFFALAGCKYPYEPPYFYFYKDDGSFASIRCLRIVKRLYSEALILSIDGTPSIFSVISLLKDNCEILNYLENNTEQFLKEDLSLFEEKQTDEIPEAKEEFGSEEIDLINYNLRISRNRHNIWKQSIEENDSIEINFLQKQMNFCYIKLLAMRMKLPAWAYQHNILKAIQENQVVIISGETGCGKSTQVNMISIKQIASIESNTEETRRNQLYRLQIKIAEK